MDIPTRDRADLKSYFVKNAIPTEGNFAELIDGMLNQADDGLVKLPGDPLSIEAVGDDASSKKLIHFYREFTDPSPDWVLDLNPRSDPDDQGTAKRGFNISDGENHSRLFIDRSTGNVGIGTASPGAKLEVAGGGGAHVDLIVSGRLRSNNNDGGLWIASDRFVGGHSTDKVGFWNGAAWRLTVQKDGNVGIGTENPQQRLVVAGPHNAGKDTDSGMSYGGSLAIKSNAPQIDFIDTDHKDWSIHVNSNKMYFIREPWNYADLILDGEGNVGIGTDPPKNKLHIKQSAASSGIRLDEHNTSNWFRIAWEGNGNIHFYRNTGYGQWMGPNGNWNYNASDISLKQQVSRLVGTLDRVMQLNPVNFTWRNSKSQDIGFVAQEVERVFPGLVSSTGMHGESVKGLPYAAFSVLAIAALQEFKRTYDERLAVIGGQISNLYSAVSGILQSDPVTRVQDKETS